MKNVEHQLAEIDHSLANYQVQLKMLQVEILKLELKKEKIQDKIVFQSLKAKIATKPKDKEVSHLSKRESIMIDDAEKTKFKA